MMQIDDEGMHQPVVYSGAPDLRAYALQGTMQQIFLKDQAEGNSAT